MKQIAIKKTYSYFSTSSEEIENCAFDKKLEQLNKELKSVFSKYGLTLAEHETVFIPQSKMSLFHCENCNHLMINRDLNPARFDNSECFNDLTLVIRDGGTHEGKNLCEECLPTSHRWGHFS